MSQSPRNILTFVFSRVLVLYLLTGVFVYKIIDHDKFRVRVINHIMLPVDYLRDVSDQLKQPDKKWLVKYLNYYKKILPISNDEGFKAETWALMGFCNYYLGRTDKAIYYYEKAVKVNPKHFYFLYNLALIHQRKKDYPKAIEYLKEALASNIEMTYVIINSSKLMQQIGRDNGRFSSELLSQRIKSNGEIKKQLGQKYSSCYKLIVWNMYQAKDYQGLFAAASVGIERGDNKDGFFYYYAAVAAMELKDYQKAVVFLNKYIKAHPKHLESLQMMVEALKVLKQNKMATMFERRIKSLKPATESSLIIDPEKLALGVL